MATFYPLWVIYEMFTKCNLCIADIGKVVLTLKAPEKSQLYGLYVYYVVHICDFGMLRVKAHISFKMKCFSWLNHGPTTNGHTVGPRLSGHQLSGYLYYPAMILHCILSIFN